MECVNMILGMVNYEIIKKHLLDSKMFIENDYFYKYINLILENKNNTPVKNQTEEHHIIPCSCYIEKGIAVDNSPRNFVTLSKFNHTQAHYLISFCITPELKPSQQRIFLNMTYSKNFEQYATLKKEANQRILVTYRGVSRSIAEWAMNLGMSYNSLARRLRQGYTLAEILYRGKIKKVTTAYTAESTIGGKTINEWYLTTGIPVKTILKRIQYTKDLKKILYTKPKEILLIEYKSEILPIKEVAKMTGIDSDTLRKRLKRGLKEPELFFPTIRSWEITYGNVSKDLFWWSKFFGIPYSTLKYHLELKQDLEEATKTKRNCQKGCGIVCDNKVYYYSDIQKICDRNNLKFSTVFNELYKGLPLSQALQIADLKANDKLKALVDKYHTSNEKVREILQECGYDIALTEETLKDRTINFEGEYHSHTYYATNFFGMTPERFTKNIKEGWTIQTLCAAYSEDSNVTINKQTYTLREWCDILKLDVNKDIYDLVKKGWRVEELLLRHTHNL